MMEMCYNVFQNMLTRRGMVEISFAEGKQLWQ